MLLALVSVATVACSLASPARSCSNWWEVGFSAATGGGCC